MSIVELGSMLVMYTVIPLKEPPSEPMITVCESVGSTVIEPANGATSWTKSTKQRIFNVLIIEAIQVFAYINHFFFMKLTHTKSMQYY